VPAIGAYLASTPSATNINPPTTARGYCPAGTPPSVTPTDTFYPQADSKPVTTDRIAATNDSKHILGASASTGRLTDLNLTLPSFGGTNNPGACQQAAAVPPSTVPQTLPFTFTTTPFTTALGVTPATITGVIPNANSAVAFVTYTTTSATTTGTKLPAYAPAASGLGTLSQVILSNGATAPVSGIFSPDGLTFYTGTSGDNLVHLINVPTLTDTKTITPALPVCALQDGNGNCTSLSTGFATPTLLADKPRPTT